MHGHQRAELSEDAMMSERIDHVLGAIQDGKGPGVARGFKGTPGFRQRAQAAMKATWARRKADSIMPTQLHQAALDAGLTQEELDALGGKE